MLLGWISAIPNASDLASGITGEILYVDAGYNITAMGSLEEVN